MKIPAIPSSEITPKDLYLSRRAFMKAAGIVAGSAALAACGVAPSSSGENTATPAADTPNSLEDITHYNNYYEFTTDKEGVASLASDFSTSPWEIEVSGLVNQGGKFSVDELTRRYPPEERIYRLRCVEAWSMVIPWVGYSLAALLKQVQPLGSAKFVEFVTQADPEHMPGLRRGGLDWPYTEGLRLDEALHPLTLLAFGMYGRVLPNQNGAPVRLVVPWKYGFKNAKSLVAIRLVEHMPATAWVKAAPHEYGFYANVNPGVPHRRWSQASERVIGQGGLLAPKRATELFNGYAEQVGSLYTGMDLKRYY